MQGKPAAIVVGGFNLQRDDGMLSWRHRPGWNFHPVRSMHALGVRVLVASDARRAWSGLGCIQPSFLTVLQEASTADVAGACRTGVLALAQEVSLSAGLERQFSSVQASYLPYSFSFSASVAGDAAMVNEFFRFIRRQRGGHGEVTVGDILGGKSMSTMYDFFVQLRGKRPSEWVETAVMASQHNIRDISPVIAEGMMLRDDRLCQAIGAFYAAFLGTAVREVIRAEGLGRLVLQGSVVDSLPGFAQTLFSHEACQAALHAPHGIGTDLAEAARIEVAGKEAMLPVIGGLQQALELAAQ